MHERGQMTVEFAVAFPVLLAVALIAVNALMFMSTCAAFDNTFRQLASTYCTSLGSGQTVQDATANVLATLSDAFDEDNVSVSLETEHAVCGYTTYIATLDFYPTYFGMSFRSSFLGVSLAPLRHQESITLDGYKPGVFL